MRAAGDVSYSGLNSASKRKTYCIVVERGIDTAMSLDLVARADEGAHLAPTCEGTLEGLEPERIRVSRLIICGAEGLEGTNDQIMALAIVVVL